MTRSATSGVWLCTAWQRQELGFRVGGDPVEVDAVAGDDLVQPLVGRGPVHGHGPDETEQGCTGFTGVEQSASSSCDLLEAMLDDGREQSVFSGEVPVDGAGSDACAAGDLVDGHGQPLGGEGRVRRFEYQFPVAGRVGA